MMIDTDGCTNHCCAGCAFGQDWDDRTGSKVAWDVVLHGLFAAGASTSSGQ